MKTLTLDLGATSLRPARLCVIERIDGQVFYIADSQTSITIGTNTYVPVAGTIFNAIKHVLGGDMPSTQIDVSHSATGTFTTEDIDAGRFDGATVDIYVVDRANIAAGRGLLFTGTIQPVSYSHDGHASFDIRGHAAKAAGLFMQKFAPMCRTDLFSVLCGVDPDAYVEGGAVLSIIDQFNFEMVSVGGSPRPDEYYNNGVMLTETGFSFEVAHWDQANVNGNSQVTTYLPICSRHIDVGMSLTAWPGCDKTMGPGGCPKYSNQARFQGEDHFFGAAAFAAGA